MEIGEGCEKISDITNVCNSDNDSLKENRPPYGCIDSDEDNSLDFNPFNHKLTQKKRKVFSSSDEDEISKPRKLSLNKKKRLVEISGSVLESDDDSDRGVQSKHNQESASDPYEKIESEDEARHTVDKAGPVLQEGSEFKSNKRLTLDSDLFDAEESGASGSDEEQSGATDEEDNPSTNKLSAKYSGPAAKGQVKAASRKSREDEKLKIYSEKQRMIREQGISVPVFEPPKRSLRDFLVEKAPHLLKALRKTDAESHLPKQVNKIQKFSKNKETPQIIKEEDDNAELRNQSAVDQSESALCGTSDGVISDKLTEDVEKQVNKPEVISSSEVIVTKKVSQDKQQAKKERLRRLLGDSVDLDLVPQLSCDENGLVYLDNKPDDATLSKFKSSFERIQQIRRQEAQKKKQQERAALKLVRSLPDGSQQELSMDNIAYKTPEETGGVHKLAVLKEILSAKLAERRNVELKKKLEIIKLEQLEEEEVEDGMEEEDDDISDAESGGFDDDDNDSNLPLGLMPEYGDDSKSEQNKELMKRVRAILESDDEEKNDDCGSRMKNPVTSLVYTAEDSLERMLGLDKSVPLVHSSEMTQLPLGETNTQSQYTAPSTSSDEQAKFISSMPEVDENAQDLNSLLGFGSAGSKSSADRMALNFSHGMFNTQQAEHEALGLCSGFFADNHVSQSQNSESSKNKKNNLEEEDADNTRNEVRNTKKKQSLYFSDEEEEANEAEVMINKQSSNFCEEPEANEAAEADDGGEAEDEDSSQSDREFQENDPSSEDEKELAGGDKSIILKPPKQTLKKKLLREYVDEEAELSGSDAPSDEDFDLDEDQDVLELEAGDEDDVGSDEHLRAQIGKIAMKQSIDDDDRRIMLMKELLLPDGDLHSDSRRQRKFKWRNMDYGDDGHNRMNESGDDNSEASDADDSDVKALHDKLNKERSEREAWLKQQREESLLQPDISCSNTADNSGIVDRNGTKNTSEKPQSQFSFNLSTKNKKPGYVLGRSKRYLERFKELHKNIKAEQSGPTSSKNLLFHPISKESAESQQEMIWDKLGVKN